MSGKVELGTDEWRKPHAKKDTVMWCGGHVGREHNPVMAKHKGPYMPDCGMGPSLIHPDKTVWHCRHQVVCADCHKVIDQAVAEDCPDRPENKAA